MRKKCVLYKGINICSSGSNFQLGTILAVSMGRYTLIIAPFCCCRCVAHCTSSEVMLVVSVLVVVRIVRPSIDTYILYYL
jgi:hypothetical protein